MARLPLRPIVLAVTLVLTVIALLRYGIDDLRRMFENDIRFLEQF